MTDIRIYVASLSDYNAGTLHGKWIDATQDVDDIWAEVQEMLAESPEFKRFPQGGPAEEWAIHDYEGFGSLRLSEYESFERVSTIANAIEEHGLAMAAWLSESGHEPDDFEDHFRGHWDSFKEYVTEGDLGDMYLGLSSLGALARGQYDPLKRGYEELVDHLSNYIDWDAVARDLEPDYTVIECGAPEYGVWIFEDNA